MKDPHPIYKFIFKTKLLTLNQALDKAKVKLRTKKRTRNKASYIGSLYDIEARKIKANIAQESLQQHPSLIMTKNYCIKFCWYCKDKRSDPDNILHGVKYILDGMQKSGILPNDGWQNVSGGHIHSFYTDKINPRVEVFFIQGNFNDSLRSLYK